MAIILQARAIGLLLTPTSAYDYQVSGREGDYRLHPQTPSHSQVR